MENADGLTFKQFEKFLVQRMKNITKDLDKEDREDNNFFITASGIEFENNYFDLSGAVSVGSLISVLLENWETVQASFTPSKIVSNAKDLIKKSKASRTNKEKALSIVDELIEMQVIAEKKLESIAELLPEFEKDTLEKDAEPDEKDVEEETIESLKEIDIVSRINAYFVLSLYAYMDAYSMNLVRELISNIESRDIYETLNALKNIKDPKSSIKSILKTIDPKLISLRDLVIQKKIEWKHDYTAFINFHTFRHKLAHREPLTPNEQILIEFPYLNQKILSILKKYRKDLKKWIKKSKLKYFDQFIVPILDAFKQFHILLELGKSCFRHLALIDLIVGKAIQIEVDIHDLEQENSESSLDAAKS